MTASTSSTFSRASARARSRLGRLLRPTSLRGGRHRDVQGSAARAAVLGSGDGLLTNISLVLGVAGATTGGSAVRLAGVAGLLAGAFSMAAGELVSVKAHDELVQHEIDVERAGRAIFSGPELVRPEASRLKSPRSRRQPLSENGKLVVDCHTPS
jgi:hypothetical protein